MVLVLQVDSASKICLILHPCSVFASAPTVAFLSSTTLRKTIHPKHLSLSHVPWRGVHRKECGQVLLRVWTVKGFMFSRQLPFSAPSSPHSKPLSIYSLLCFPGSCILGLFFGYPRLRYFPSLILFRFIWLSTPQFLRRTNQRFLNGLYSVSYPLTAQKSLNSRFLSLSCFLNGVCE